MHQASGKQVSTHSIASLDMTARASQAIIERLSRCGFTTSSLASGMSGPRRLAKTGSKTSS